MRSIQLFSLVIGLSTSAMAAFEQDFFNLINLDHSSMVRVKPLVQAANYDSAFKVYRDTLLLRLRKADLGSFGWHSYQTHPRPLSFARRLVDSLSESAYVSQASGIDYMDTQGMSGAPGTIGTIRWDRALRSDRKDDYSWYRNFTPLATRYFQTRSRVYLDKYFEITTQFAQNQKSQVLALPAAEQKQFQLQLLTRRANGSQSGAPHYQYFAANMRCLPSTWALPIRPPPGTMFSMAIPHP
jgi:hypothetical protein